MSTVFVRVRLRMFTPSRGFAVLVTEMLGQLDVQRGLKHVLRALV
ncbi:MAG: hypothetical protein Q4B08_11490 [Propionibacteriaceae bacterium]|nr:hypothetical protein [Propionibacteriaceae bacterium]